MKKGTSYVVAGTKDWNRKDFQQLTRDRPEMWSFAEDELVLKAILEREAPRYIFFLHWNWRVRQDVLQRFECVCFHMTDVPYGRGGSPLQNLIGAGHSQTVVSALRMVEEMDAGPVYAKRPLSLEGRAEDIFKRAGAICIDMIEWMVASEPVPVPQSGEVVLFKRRVPAQSELPSTGSLRGLYDHIRMLDAPSYPLAFMNHGDFRLEFADPHLEDGELVARVFIKSRAEKD